MGKLNVAPSEEPAVKASKTTRKSRGLKPGPAHPQGSRDTVQEDTEAQPESCRVGQVPVPHPLLPPGPPTERPRTEPGSCFTTLIEYSNYSVQIENTVFSYKCIISKAEHSTGLVTVWTRCPRLPETMVTHSETPHASQEQVALNPGLLRQDEHGAKKRGY